MRPTIKDVARRAGVSTATVSRILAGGASAIRISASTRERVLLSSREIGYTPDARASSLRSQRSRLIGVIARDITQAFPSVLIAILDTVLKEHGYELLLAQGQTQCGVDRFPEAFDHYRVRGVILVGTPHRTADTAAVLAEYARRLDRHVVGLTYSGTLELPVSVHVDDREGIQLAVDHLVALGHQRIGFAGAPVSVALGDRLAIFRDYAASVLGTESAAVEKVETVSARTGGEAMLRLLSLADRPTAVIFANDEMAMGGLMAAYQAGYSVPGDVSIVGFDDIPLADGCWPPLTTLRQPARDMAECAVRCLIDLLDKRVDAVGSAEARAIEQPLRQHVFAPELLVRASTAPPPTIRRRAPVDRKPVGTSQKD
jgi:DNA-binding LacI/PurR family transcriptional regulator